jgi:hypothetical protein
MDAKASDRNRNLAIRNLSRRSSVAVCRLKGRSSFLGSRDQNLAINCEAGRASSSGSFSIALDAQVPTKIQVHSFTSEAEQLAPQVRGFGHVIAEGQTALVDQRAHKVEIVFARRGGSK